MKLNSTVLTEEQKLERLRKLTSKAPLFSQAKVFAPAGLANEESDLALVGYRSETPLSFNITDYFKVNAGPGDAKYPFFNQLGAGVIGMFISAESLEKLSAGPGRPFAEFLQDSPEEALDLLRQYILPMDESGFIIGFKQDGQLVFHCYREGRFHAGTSETYSLGLDVFSRNTGILETGMMKSMTAVISGCGSVGSYVAIELARSGVGRFLLIDNDVISYANVCRHQCGIADVGRYKANAVADRIRLINPEARIGIETTVVENVPPAVFEEFCGPGSVIIGCADNRQGDLFACKIAACYNMPMVSIGFWERAFAGEVFYWIPERKDLACYQCFVNALGDISGRQSVNRRFYTSETDLSKVNFMPGISVDITFVTNIGVKIIIDIFNRNNPKFIPRLIDSLTQFSLVANTQKQEIGGEQAAIFSYPLQVTTSIEVVKTANCKLCNKTVS